jgi:inosine/xanthosine triphosphatase
MKVIVGSKNPVKLNGTKSSFSKYFENFEIIGEDVESGVSNMPINDETHKGAENRAKYLYKRYNSQYVSYIII